MIKYLALFVSIKKYSIYVSGEFERCTNFLGIVKLLFDYSDFFRYSYKNKMDCFKQWIKSKVIPIDCNITAKFNLDPKLQKSFLQ